MKIALVYAPSPPSSAMTGYVLRALESIDGINVFLVCEAASLRYRVIRKLRRTGLMAAVRDAWNRAGASARYTTDKRSVFSDVECERAVQAFARTRARQVRFTNDVQSDASLRWLDTMSFDLLCLMDAGGIVREPLLKRFSTGIVNAHGGGRLPEFRGSDALEWSIWELKRPWVNTHFVDLGIDTGPVLLQAPMPLQPGDTMNDLLRRRDQMRATLLVDTIKGIHMGHLRPQQQGPEEGRTYYRMHPRLRRLLPRRLETLKEGEGMGANAAASGVVA